MALRPLEEKYDLVLMMDDEKEIGIQRVEDFLKRNKPFQGKPILIKQGDQFSLYGLSEKGQWQLTHGLNPSSFAGLPFKQWTGEHTSFPPEEEKRIEQLSLITARKDEILRKIQDKGLHSRLEKELEVRLQQIDEIEKGFKKENKGGKEGKAGKEEPTPRDSWSRKKQEQREAALLNKMRGLVPTQTKGGGDCALHAILGEWNPLEHQLVCADMTGKRKQIRTAIESKEHKEPLRGLIVAGIKELVMSGRDIGKASQKLRSHYRRFLSDQKDFSSVLWPRFEGILQQHLPIMEYIQKKHRLDKDSSLRDRFYDALNHNEGELYGRILSLPGLHEAFQEYSQLQNVEFDWDSAISMEIKEEYARFVGTAHVWLLPSELAVIAHLFHVTVIYYPHPEAWPLTLNPGESSTVEVQFNGTNHFERLELNHEEMAVLLSSNQIPKPSIKK